MNIRILGYKDAEQYHKVRLHGLLNYPTFFSTSYEHENNYTVPEIEQRLRPQADKFTLGAFGGNQLLGIATFKRETSAKLNHKGLLVGMYVMPEARENGVARAMIEELLRLLRENEGLEQLHLTVESTNERAIGLYESLGFKQYALERRALKVDGNYYDEVWMFKEL
ncbi:ribosomal-protein-alanine acetyltransferase [Solibacillus isronensis B3W22]|uniref:Ribosomal-protein-alanine acetyltransferase n=1 Tax=Solibacillus isronensis B3W22 TaxID=1224748 RepID=K1KRH5_9BACL|nr:GNAT family protein [Solibacillus isronensis]AMO86531.1 histone acetyltransferase [Solibacillus silvestris]EKB45111.1 ribosomal-protein-alanine acetyltransferase [Solibacillus isronensis B3W22]